MAAAIVAGTIFIIWGCNGGTRVPPEEEVVTEPPQPPAAEEDVSEPPEPPAADEPSEEDRVPPVSGGADAEDVLEEVFFGGGAGGGGATCDQMSPDPGDPLPTIIATSRDTAFFADFDKGMLCVYGYDLPLDESIFVHLELPDGEQFDASYEFQPSGPGEGFFTQTSPSIAAAPDSCWPWTGGMLFEQDGMTVVGIRLWWPVGMPEGDWFAIVASSRTEIADMIEVDPVPGPRISALPDTRISPFENYCGYEMFQAGEDVIIKGKGFDPYWDVTIGGYLETPVDERGLNPGLLVHSAVATANGDGYFVSSFHISADDPSGWYYAVAMTGLDDDICSLVTGCVWDSYVVP